MAESGGSVGPGSFFAAYVPFPDARPERVRVTLARAEAEDCPALAAFQAGVRGGPVARWAERIGRAVSGERSAVVLARVGEEIAGYGNVSFLPRHPGDGAPEGYYLTGVTVAPRWRRRGVGAALTRWRMAWAWERSSTVWCFVSAGNPVSLDLHRTLGFREVRRAASIQGVGFDAGEGVLLSAQSAPAAEDPAGTGRFRVRHR
jgi:phosphinothricin acetyltransferase